MQDSRRGLLALVLVLSSIFPIITLFQLWSPIITLIVGALIYFRIRKDPDANQTMWIVGCFGPALVWIAVIGMLTLAASVDTNQTYSSSIRNP